MKQKCLPKILLASFSGCFALYVLISIFISRYPSGEVPIALGDEAWQFLPFYSDLWNVIHGKGETSLFFSWHAGLGVPRIADYTTYLGGPLPLLIGLFPRESIGLGYFLIKGLKFALAGSSFCALVYYLFPIQKISSYVLFSLIYAFSGWTIEMGMVRIIWIDGLISLPLIILAGYWSTRFKNRLLSITIIFLGWWSNYYTAYMASIGSALFITLYIFICTEAKLIEKIKRIANFAINGIIGVAACSFLLIPTYMAVSESISIPGREYEAPNLIRLGKSLYGGSFSYPENPTIFVGIFTLICLSSFIFNTKINIRIKLFGTALILFSFGSFFFEPSAMFWNLFDSPNGSWFRPAFVIVFFLSFLGFYGFTRLKEMTICSSILSNVLVAIPAIYLIASKKSFFASTSVTTFAFACILLSAILAHFIYCINFKSRVLKALGTTIVFVSILPMILINSKIATGHFLNDLASLNYPNSFPKIKQEPKTATVFEYSGIPFNIGLLYGTPESSYYSSVVPTELGNDFTHYYGVISNAGGRMVSLNKDPYMRAISGTKYAYNVKVDESRLLPVQELPFISIDPGNVSQGTDLNDPNSAFLNREAPLGSPIYSDSFPLVTVNGIEYRPGVDVLPNLVEGDSVQMSCASGEVPQLIVQDGTVRALVNGEDENSYSRGKIISGLSENMNLTVVSTKENRSASNFSFSGTRCLDLAKLDSAIKAREEVPSDRGTKDFSFDSVSNQTYRVRIPFSEKWECQNAQAQNSGSFLTLRSISGGEISCHYRQPGQTQGLMLSLASLGIALLFSIHRKTRESRKGEHSRSLETLK